MTRRHAIANWVAAVALGAALALPSPAAAAQDYSETCRYFAGQAFKDRRARRETTFRMDLAQDCVDALIYQRSDDPAAIERAERYLDQLERYRRVLVDMLVLRARQRSSTPSDPRRYVRHAITPVSWSGAYLIARDMGLVDTHQDWTVWRRNYAAADPRFRID